MSPSQTPPEQPAQGAFRNFERMEITEEKSEAQWEHPDERVLLVWRLSNLLGYGLVLGLGILGALIHFLLTKRLPLWFAIGLCVVAALWAFSAIVVKKQWQNWTFRVSEDALEMCHGWIWKTRRVVARDRIQHVDINSGPFDRKFGLVQVVVHTAGTSVGMIPGIRPDRAERLRDELMAGRNVQ